MAYVANLARMLEPVTDEEGLGSAASLLNLAIMATEPKTINQLCKETGIKYQRARDHLKFLVDRKLVLEVEATSGGAETVFKSQLDAVVAEKDRLDNEWAAKYEQLKKEAGSQIKKLIIERWDGKKVEMKNPTLPAVYEDVLDLAKCRRHTMLVGPAGCGKTYLAGLVARSLDMPLRMLSCTAGMSEGHLVGRAVPDLKTGKTHFNTTGFVETYEKGGVFLLDELDAADPNLLLAINAALAGSEFELPARPDDPIAKKHPNFICIATANTFGRGATRVYAGRNQLDEATIDRFRIGTVECDYDMAVERKLCPADEIREKCQLIRKKIEDAGLRRVMSSRFMEDAYIMHTKSKWDLSKILDVYFKGWTGDEKLKVDYQSLIAKPITARTPVKDLPQDCEYESPFKN